MVSHKRCSNPKCERADQMLPASEFYRKRSSRPGLASWCRRCKRAAERKRARLDRIRIDHSRDGPPMPKLNVGMEKVKADLAKFWEERRAGGQPHTTDDGGDVSRSGISA